MGSFLSTLAPDIGQQTEDALVCDSSIPESTAKIQKHEEALDQSTPLDVASQRLPPSATAAPGEPQVEVVAQDTASLDHVADNKSALADQTRSDKAQLPEATPNAEIAAHDSSADWHSARDNTLFDQVKNVLAAIGVVSLALLIIKAAG